VSVSKPNDSRPETPESVQNKLLALVGQMLNLTVKERKGVVLLFAGLLRQGVIPSPSTPLHDILQEAAKRAGWTPPSVRAQRRQQVAAKGRNKQRHEDLALRRVLVSHVFKMLRPGLQAKPSSIGTAQAIIGQLEQLPFERKPPMTIRTIQEDIRFMRENGGFGI
jgi:hypothetical protein